MFNQDFKDREIEFQMDDLSDEVYFEGCDEHTLTEMFMIQLFEKIKLKDWFVQGNKTEGIVTFHSDNELTIEWKSITMGDDWDTDEEVEHKQDVLLNIDPSQWEVINYN